MFSTKRLVPSIAVILVAAFALAACSAAQVPVGNPDPARVPDGVHNGAYSIFPVKVRVAVTVASGRIESIELLEHFNGKGGAAEAIIPLVIERQSLAVDVIAGASHSSTVILKAIENALSEAGKGS